MNIQNSIETYIIISFNVLSLIGSGYIIRIDWKKYGLLFILSGVVGSILCYIFVKIGFYSFPYRLFPKVSIMPFETILFIFPFIVLFGVRYSPKQWVWKIPFYWGIVHTGMLAETLALNFTGLIRYDLEWDFWDSYTWWWIYLLIFDWVGSLVVPDHLRKPVNQESFRYGKWAWAVFHFIVLTTVFLGGFYLGGIAR